MRRRRVVVAGLAAVGLAAAAGPAWAFLAAGQTGAATAVAGTLRTPQRLDTAPAASSSVPGDVDRGGVRLTWRLTAPGGAVEPAGFYVERWSPSAATPPLGTSRTPVLVPCSDTCTWTDETAVFNASYRYRVTSKFGNVWESDPSSPRLSASLAPASASVGEASFTLRSVAAVDGSHVMAVGTGGVVKVCGASCTGTGAVWTAAASPVSTDLNRVVAASSSDVWAVGNGGVIIHCTASCFTASPTWATVTLGGTPNLYGIYVAGSTYAAAVGAGGLWYSKTPTVPASWSHQLAIAGTLYDVAGKSPKDVVAVGTNGGAGYVAGCVAGGTNKVCGDSGAGLSQRTWSAAPAIVSGVAWTGGRYVAAGVGGVVGSTATGSSSWSGLESGATGDLTAVVPVPGADQAVVAGPAGTLIGCGVSCSAKSPAPAHQVTGLASASIAGVAHYWATGADSTGALPKISHLTGSPSAWDVQTVPSVQSSVDAAALGTYGSGTGTVTAPTLGGGANSPTTCGTTSLRVTVTVPARSVDPATTVTQNVMVRAAMSFPGNSGGASAWVFGSLNGGSTWSGPVPLGTVTGTSALVAVGKAVPGLSLDIGAQPLSLCVVGSAAGRTMAVDLLHVDVAETSGS